MHKKNIPTFYNPKLDNPSREEKFLKTRRMRLIEKIQRLAVIAQEKPFYNDELRVLTRKLRATEAKLGIKP